MSLSPNPSESVQAPSQPGNSAQVVKRPRKQSLPSDDPYDVYTAAVTAKSNRSTETTLDLKSSENKSTHQPVASTHSAVRSWDREKKAGPSILAKRARSESVFQPGSKRERRDIDTSKNANVGAKPKPSVVPPANKLTSTKAADNDKSTQLKAKNMSKAKETKAKPVSAPSAKAKPTSEKRVEEKTQTHKPKTATTANALSADKKDKKATDKKPSLAKQSSATAENGTGLSSPRLRAPTGIKKNSASTTSINSSLQATVTAATTASAAAITSKPSMIIAKATTSAKPHKSIAEARIAATAALQRSRQTRTQKPSSTTGDDDDGIDTAEGALAAMAAASAAVVGKKNGRRGMLGGGEMLSGGMALAALRQANSGGGSLSGMATPNSSSASMSFLRKKMEEGVRGKAGLGANGCSKITAAQQEAFARRGGINALGMGLNNPGSIASAGTSLTAGRPSTQTKSPTSASAKTNAPTNSKVALDIQFIPGSQPIDGVPPNGYTVSERGVVSPVVAFIQRPKVPMKFRQNVLEKVFSAWKDERKVSEALALQKSLQTEQETYARSVGNVEYRTAMLSKLKEIRGGEGKPGLVK